jgi:hypothetical protein
MHEYYPARTAAIAAFGNCRIQALALHRSNGLISIDLSIVDDGFLVIHLACSNHYFWE